MENSLRMDMEISEKIEKLSQNEMGIPKNGKFYQNGKLSNKGMKMKIFEALQILSFRTHERGNEKLPKNRNDNEFKISQTQMSEFRSDMEADMEFQSEVYENENP